MVLRMKTVDDLVRKRLSLSRKDPMDEELRKAVQYTVKRIDRIFDKIKLKGRFTHSKR